MRCFPPIRNIVKRLNLCTLTFKPVTLNSCVNELWLKEITVVVHVAVIVAMVALIDIIINFDHCSILSLDEMCILS